MLKIKLILPINWLSEFKQLIRYPYNDIDVNLNSYLNISITNIATQYLGLDENLAEEWFPQIIEEDRVKVATFHLAATFYENPDILLTNSNGSVVDKNQIFRILGGLTKFYLSASKTTGKFEPPKSDIWDAINKNTDNILINTNDIILIKNAMSSLTNEVTINKNDISNVKNDLNDFKNVFLPYPPKIDLNTANIEINKKNIDSNLILINKNKDDILINTNSINVIKTDLGNLENVVDSNSKNIVINTTNINNSKIEIDKNIKNIETNKTIIDSTLILVNKNIVDITNNTNSINVVRNDLGDLGNIVNTNTQAITTNKTLIVANTAAITTNKTNIIANTANITKLTATVDKTYDVNVEFDTGQKFGTKIIYGMLVSKGNLKNQTETIPNTGTLINNVDLFLGVEWGVIARLGSPQIHNINSVSNLPNEHASIIYQDINTNSIKYWFNQTMTLATFKNRPFQALIKYTKR